MKYSFHSLKPLAAIGGGAGCRELWHHGVTFPGGALQPDPERAARG